MDKIREEFEKPENFNNWPIFWKECYIDGRESRDNEIKKLRDALERVLNELLDDKIPEDIYSFIERVGIIAKEALKESE